MTDSKKPIDFFVKLTETHPFISVLQYAGQDFVGIVQNRDDLVTTIYDYGAIVDADKRLKFSLFSSSSVLVSSSKIIAISIADKEIISNSDST